MNVPYRLFCRAVVKRSAAIIVDSAASARDVERLLCADVQDVVGVAVGGREAGVVFEGDRHFEIVVRLPEKMRLRNACHVGHFASRSYAMGAIFVMKSSRR